VNTNSNPFYNYNGTLKANNFISMYSRGADVRSIAIAFGVGTEYVKKHIIRYVAKRHSQLCETPYFQAMASAGLL